MTLARGRACARLFWRQAAGRAASLETGLAWYDTLLAPTLAGPSECVTNWEWFLEERTSWGCATDEEAAAFDCSTRFEGESPADPSGACCHGGGPTDQIVLSQLSDKDLLNRCEDAADGDCCPACAEASDENIAADVGLRAQCDPEHYVSVAICASEDNAEGFAPLPVGWDCNADGVFALPGPKDALTCETWDEESETDVEYEYSAPDCAHVDAAIAANIAAEEIFAQAEEGECGPDLKDASPWARQQKSYGLISRAAVAGSSLYIPANGGCVLMLEPTMNAKTVAFYEGESIYLASVENPGTTDFRAVRPKLLTHDGADPIVFSAGDVTVLGGTNEGAEITFTTKGNIIVYGLRNEGPVKFEDVHVYTADVVNDASINVVDGSATLYNIRNSGGVTVNGGMHNMFSIENTGDVSASGAEVIMDDVTNEGSISCDGGSVVGTAISNSGQVTVEGDAEIDVELTTNAGGVITIKGKETSGVITIAAGGEVGEIDVGKSSVEVIILSGDKATKETKSKAKKKKSKAKKKSKKRKAKKKLAKACAKAKSKKKCKKVEGCRFTRKKCMTA